MNKWKTVRLGDVCSSISNTYRGNNEDVVLINTSDVLEGKILNHNLVKNEKLKGQFKKTFQKDDILYSEIRPANKRFAFVDIEKTNNYIASTKLMVIRSNKNKILPKFLYSILKSDDIINELQQLAETRSGTFPQITFSAELGPMKILLPPLNIQNKIASVLSVIDDKIELNNRINKNLEEQAMTLFKSWFIDFESFGGKMPDDWRIGKLKDILKLKKNSIKQGENTSLPYLPIDIIPMHSLAINEFRPNLEAQSSLITFDKDDILIGAMRVYFHRVTIAPCAGITRTTCFVLSPYDKNYLIYALMMCNQKESIDFAQTTSKGSTMPYAVWDGGLGDLEINIPPKNIAEEFNNIILPSMRKIQNSYYENTRLAQLRDTLLPKLMSGEIDVNKVEV